MSSNESQDTSQPPAKKIRLQTELAIHRDKMDFAKLTIEDVVNVSPNINHDQLQYLEANSLFLTFKPGFLDLQERFWSIRKHRAEHSAKWLEDKVTSSNRQHLKIPIYRQICLLRTYAKIRETADAACNYQVAQAAVIYEACAAASLITASVLGQGVLDDVPDVRERFDAALTYMEIEIPKHPVNTTIHARVNAGTQTPRLRIQRSAISSTVHARVNVGTQTPRLRMTVPTNASATIPLTPASMTSGLQQDSRSDDYLRRRVADFRVPLKNKRIVSWERICGQDKIKGELDEEMLLIRYADTILISDERFPNMLLYGPNGTGKSALVTAFAKHYDLPLFSVKGAIKGSLQGETEKLMGFLFDEIRANQPCVLFFDEADAIIRDAPNDASLSSFIGIIKMEWASLIDDRAKVFIFGASNRPWDIPVDGFSRRFSRLIYMGLPDLKTRQELFATQLHPDEELTEQQLEELSHRSDGFSGWDIHDAIGSARKELRSELLTAKSWEKVQTRHGEVMVPTSLRPGDQPVRLADLHLEGGHQVAPRSLTFDMLRSYFDPASEKLLRKTVNESSIDQYHKWAASM